MKTRHKLLLILSSIALVSGISSCAPAGPVALDFVPTNNGYGDTIEDAVVVINDNNFPWASGHTVKVQSLVSDRIWSMTFPHVCLEGQCYVLWSDNTYTRVTRGEAGKHASILLLNGKTGRQVETRRSSSSSSSSDNSSKCSFCGGDGKTIGRWGEESCSACGGDGYISYPSYRPDGWYFLIRH